MSDCVDDLNDDARVVGGDRLPSFDIKLADNGRFYHHQLDDADPGVLSSAATTQALLEALDKQVAADVQAVKASASQCSDRNFSLYTGLVGHSLLLYLLNETGAASRLALAPVLTRLV